MKGQRYDAHEYAQQAVEQGAAALLCERSLGLGVPEVVVDDVRQIMAHMAAALYGHPSKKTEVIAVTGTNGKTTVVAMLATILKQAGHPVRTLGTLSAPDTLSVPDTSSCLLYTSPSPRD